MSFKESLVDAGASPTQASKGKALLLERNGLREAFTAEHKRQLRKLELMGAELSAEQQESVVRGTLLDVVLNEKSAPRVRAAELLGRDRRVNLFTQDTAVGIFNLAIPSGWESRYISTTPEPNALAQDTPKGLSSFEPRVLESGVIEVQAPHAEEPLPVAVPSPTTDFSEDDFETL